MSSPARTPLVDVHAHFLTAGYVDAARAAGHVRPDGMAGWPTWSADDHLRLMDESDVGRAVLSISSPGVHFGEDHAARLLARQVNDAGAAICRAHPDRFGQFASLPLPDIDGALTELTRALDELGCDGVTLETNVAGVYLGDRRYEPLYEELNRRQAVVFVHPTSPPHAEQIALGLPRPMLEFIFDSARAVSNLVFSGVLTSYRDIRWVFTHGGGALPLLAERMELFRSVFLDDPADGPTVPDQMSQLWFDMAGTPFPRQVPIMVEAFGSDRLLYGSDYCWTPVSSAARQVASIDSAPQPGDDSWRALTTRNARKLFAHG